MLAKEKGLTFAETMLVIVIIGVLAAVALLEYARYADRSRSIACLSARRSLFAASTVYYAERGAWPSDAAALSQYLPNYADLTCPSGGRYGFDADGAITCDVPAHGTVIGPLASPSPYGHASGMSCIIGDTGVLRR